MGESEWNERKQDAKNDSSIDKIAEMESRNKTSLVHEAMLLLLTRMQMMFDQKSSFLVTKSELHGDDNVKIRENQPAMLCYSMSAFPPSLSTSLTRSFQICAPRLT